MERPSRPPLHRNPTSGSIHEESTKRESRAGQSTRESKRQTSASGRASSPEGPPFACPYSKHDPDRYSHKNIEEQDYRNCSTGYWTSIPRLKQHLYRTHDRSLRCCPRCWLNFPNDETLRRHVESSECQRRPVPEEKMDAEKHHKVKERIQGQPAESWYKIYHVLFPRDQLPSTPFAEWVTGNDLRTCFERLVQRLPRLLVEAAVEQGMMARNIPLTQHTGFPTTANIVQHALVQVQKEFGDAMGMRHIFATGPPSLQGRSESTSSRSQRTTQSRQARNVSEMDEDDDSSSGASYHAPTTHSRRPTAHHQQQFVHRTQQPPGIQPSMPFTSVAYLPGTPGAIDATMFEGLELSEDLYPPYMPEDDWSQY